MRLNRPLSPPVLASGFRAASLLLLLLAGCREGSTAESTNTASPTTLLPASAVVSVTPAQSGSETTSSNTQSTHAHPRVTFHAAPRSLAPDAVLEDWPCFLGPRHAAISGESPLLKDWPEGGPTLVWEMERGTSYASPAIAAGRLIYLHRLGDEEVVECLNPESGEAYWEFRYPTTYSDRYGYNDGPRASPVIDGDRVYTYSAQGVLHCLDLTTGAVRWRLDTAERYRKRQDFFGNATTPLVEGDRLIVNIGADGGPSVVSLNPLTGEELWRAGDEWGASYASPVPATVHGRRVVYVFAGGESRPPTGGLLCIDPADGQILFKFPWRSRSFESVNASSPVVCGEDMVFISASYDTGGAMLRVKSDWSHEVVWTSDGFGTHWSTAVYRDGYLYGFDGRHDINTVPVCFEAATGKEMWREDPTWEEEIEVGGQRRTQQFSLARGALLWADGAFLCLGEFGHLLWLDLSPSSYRQLARARPFLAQETWTPPVLSRGLLYVVQNARDKLSGPGPRLLCFDLRGSR